MKLFLSLSIFCVAIALFYYAYQLYTENNIAQQQEITVEEVTTQAESTSVQIASFINNSKIAEGEFPARMRCESNTCTPMVADNTTPSGYAIQALLIGARESDNDSLKTTADEVINRILRLCENDVTVCERNFYALQDYYEITDDEQYLSALIKSGNYIVNQIKSGESIENLVQRNTYEKLTYLYWITTDETYKELVISAAESAYAKWPNEIESTSLYSVDSYEVTYHTPFVVNGLFLPAYQLTNDNRYLVEVQNYLNKANIVANIDDLTWEGGLIFILNTVEAMLSYNELVASEVFLTDARNIMQEILWWQYDTPEQTIYNADYGVRTGVLSKNEIPGVNYKNINLNGRIAVILSNPSLSEDEFTLFKGNW